MQILNRSGRLLAFCLVVVCLFGTAPSNSFAAMQTKGEMSVTGLKTLGLFSGTDYGDQLNRQPTRMEGTIMLIRLMGADHAAAAGSSVCPFTDVPKWAKPYAQYAVDRGLVTPESKTEFGTNQPLTEDQFLDMLLRGLGFAKKGAALKHADAVKTAARIGLIPQKEEASQSGMKSAKEPTDRSGMKSPKEPTDQSDMKSPKEPTEKPILVKPSFSRGDMVQIAWNWLGVTAKGEKETMAQKLVKMGIFSQSQYESASALIKAGPKDVKTVYLTFDDGPDRKVTPRILDTLKQYDIKATFFVVGNQVDAHPQMLQNIYAQGHRIGNHSYDHIYKKLYENPSNLLEEIHQTEGSIDKALGFEYKNDLFRFPGGSFEKSDALKTAVTQAGYQYYDWNCSGEDASIKGASTSAEILKSVMNTNLGRKKVIVLLHSAAPKSTTADALPQIIRYFMKQGYVFRTLTDPEGI